MLSIKINFKILLLIISLNMFSLIVAIEKQTGGIGYKNDLIVRLKKDMAHFRKTTTNTQEIEKENVVVMGRKTWESIPEK